MSTPSSGPGRAARGSAPRDAERLYLAAYEEGRRAVDDQIAELDSMRQRSVQFLAFVGSATAFLVAAGIRQGVVRDGTFYAVATVATAASLASIVLVLSVLLGWVRNGWRVTRAFWSFRLSPEVLIEDWIEPDLGAHNGTTFFRDVALHYDKMESENESQLGAVRRSYWLFLTVGSVQVLLWAALVWICG